MGQKTLHSVVKQRLDNSEWIKIPWNMEYGSDKNAFNHAIWNFDQKCVMPTWYWHAIATCIVK